MTNLPQHHTLLGDVWRRFMKRRLSVVALGCVLALVLVALAAPWISPFDPAAQDVLNRLQGPSSEHLLGTDDLGRDVLSRLIHGARISLMFAFQVVGLSLLVALPTGIVAGYFGGWIDFLIMRAFDAIMSFPALVMAIAIVAVLGPNLTNAMFAIAIVVIPAFGRLARGASLAVREEHFIAASTIAGSSRSWIMARRVLPNVASPIIVQATTVLGYALIAEASLSFLGLGAQPPDPSWGGMLRRNYDFILSQPWDMLMPGAAIALAVLALNTAGDGLRDALNRSTKRSGGSMQTAVPSGNIETRARIAIDTTSAERSPGNPEPVLRARHISVGIDAGDQVHTVVDDVSFDLCEGEVLGLVGESGSGKTVTALSLLRLLPSPPFRLLGGEVWVGGQNTFTLTGRRLAETRGGGIGMVFQDPVRALNPSRTIGSQVAEAVGWHRDASRRGTRQRAAEVLGLVGVPASRHEAYPYELSGGMCQRAMIAMALACEPKVVIADEPTSALDVTVQAQILELLHDVRQQLGMAILLVTHDVGVIADMCDRVCVMYAGQVVEQQPVHDLFRRPRHPYTEALFQASPERTSRGSRLATIPGSVPHYTEFGPGCRFAGRCRHVVDDCLTHAIDLKATPQSPHGEHHVRCRRADELQLQPSVSDDSDPQSLDGRQ